uniref:Uncharacterized protein n=5 Tax=Salix TaxID=40685 RepID=A0A6N2KLM3_SALVM
MDRSPWASLTKPKLAFLPMSLSPYSICFPIAILFLSAMAGGNFMHRVLSYVVNELVVNGLANSPAFQRFAVKTSRRIDDISNLAAKKKQELAEQVKDLSKNIDVSMEMVI